MAKRFLDTGFLSQKWIRKLKPKEKCFLIYIMLECDNAGIIEIDFEDVEFWIGEEIDQKLSFLPKDYVIFMKDLDKYFIPKFIEYQYGDLSSNKNIVAQARRILNKYGLLNGNNEIIINDFILKLPKSQVTSNSTGNSIDNSKDKENFVAEVLQLKTPSNGDHVRNFIVYWTELTPDGSKMKFQLEKTWETRKRLQTWIQRSK